MSTYIVAYDLQTPGQDYTNLYKHLRSYGTYSHAEESVWVIVTDRSATQVRDAATVYLDKNDKLLVVLSGGVGAWHGMSASTTEWLRKYL